MKLSVCFGLIALTLSLCSCDKGVKLSGTLPDYETVKIPANANVSSTNRVHVDAMMSYANTLAEATNSFDAIVLGKPTQNFASRVHGVRYLPQDPDDSDTNQYVESEWSEGTFQIERVLYQKPGHSLSAGQTLPIVEPVGVAVTATSRVLKSVIEDCYEIKQNSKYILFIGRGTDGTYGTDNFNRGRFNTDGTDCEDEVGIVNGMYPNGVKTDKQKLREELTAQYGITFAPIGPCAAAQPRISAMILGRPRPDGTTAYVRVRITPPQPGNSMLQIEQAYNSTGPWTQIANVPVIASAQSGTTDVDQTQYFRGLDRWVRYRIVNGNPSAWSDPVAVTTGL